jgi:hypothetical protein
MLAQRGLSQGEQPYLGGTTLLQTSGVCSRVWGIRIRCQIRTKTVSSQPFGGSKYLSRARIALIRNSRFCSSRFRGDTADLVI